MGQNWAITIGINHYRNLQRLDYARQDAEAMQAFLKQELNIQTVYHFTDDSPPIPASSGPPLDSLPTFANLKRFLRVRFEEPFLKPGDNLWFFFAGHGKRHEDRDYLMPIDADPGDETDRSTWIPLSDVTDRLRRSGADNVVMLIDACRSGSGRRDGSGFGQEKQQGVITLFACSPWESSYEIEELKQGAFTYSLLQSLQIEGEGNCATVERLYHRLRQTVPQVTQQYKRVQQTPYGVVEPPTKYHLILLPRKATLRDAETLKMEAYKAETNRSLELAEQLWIRVLAVSPADPDAIAGIRRLAQTGASTTPGRSKPVSNQSGRRSPTRSPLPLPRLNLSRRQLLQLAGVGGVGFGGALLSRLFLPFNPAAQTTANSSLKPFEFDVVKVNAQGKELPRQRNQAQFLAEELGNGITIEMVAIKGGTFTMGSPPGEEGRDWYKNFDKNLVDVEGPQHQVTIQSFLMGKYPVTQAQWKAVAALPKIKQDLNPDPANFKGVNRPVEQVSWHDALEFCARLSQKTGREYRLPSEAEWEYACRAGTTTPFHFGETITTELANYNGNNSYASAPKGKYREQTTDVGSFPANAFGLYDLHGNVWEWCLDHWHGNYKGAPNDGTAWTTGGNSDRRILRGGSWILFPRNCRSAFRYLNSPAYRFSSLGFRVVCSAPRTL